MTKFAKNRRGAKRKAGARYANGRLKPVDPRNKIVAARRLELCADPAMATTPLDCALANGFISPTDYRAAMIYAGAFRASRIAPAASTVAKDLSTPASLVDVRGVSYAAMSDAEIMAVWSSVETHTKGLWGVSDSDESEAAALRRWHDLNQGLTADQRAELMRVAIMDSWPHWINQWIVAGKMVKRIQGENRKATQEEADRWKGLKVNIHTRQRSLLIAACASVRLAMTKDRFESAPLVEGSITPVPGPKVAETTIYETSAGVQVLEVVRVRRKGATI